MFQLFKKASKVLLTEGGKKCLSDEGKKDGIFLLWGVWNVGGIGERENLLRKTRGVRKDGRKVDIGDKRQMLIPHRR